MEDVESAAVGWLGGERGRGEGGGVFEGVQGHRKMDGYARQEQAGPRKLWHVYVFVYVC